MLKLFCFLTGDNYTLVSNETPASHKKIMVLGSVMLIPTLMWLTISFGLSRSFFETGHFLSITIGLMASGIIFILERAIIMSGQSIGIAIFRVLIGMVIAFLGAIFFDEMIFEKDIIQHQFQERAAIVEYETSKINAYYQPQIQHQQMVVDKLRTSWMAAAEEARKEADGTGGSGQRGISGITRLKQEQVAAMREELDKNEQKIISLISERDQIRSDKSAEIESNLHGHSILFRVKSLFNLINKDWVVLLVYIALTAFLFALEFIVIIMKHTLPKTNYERRLEAMEEIGKRRIERIIDSGIKNFDPGANSNKVMLVNKELEANAPSLFKVSRAVGR